MTILRPDSIGRWENGIGKILDVEGRVISDLTHLQEIVSGELYQAARTHAVGILPKGSISPSLTSSFSNFPIVNNSPKGALIHIHDYSVALFPCGTDVPSVVYPNQRSCIEKTKVLLKTQDIRDRIIQCMGCEKEKEIREALTLIDETLALDSITVQEFDKVLNAFAYLFYETESCRFTESQEIYDVLKAHQDLLVKDQISISSAEADAYLMFRGLAHARSLQRKNHRIANDVAHYVYLNDPSTPAGQLGLAIANKTT